MLAHQLDLFGVPIHPSENKNEGKLSSVNTLTIVEKNGVAEQKGNDQQPLAENSAIVVDNNMSNQVSTIITTSNYEKEAQQKETTTANNHYIAEPFSKNTLNETAVATSSMPIEIVKTEEEESLNYRGKRTLQTLEETKQQLNLPSDAALQQKQYYNMRDTAAMFGVNQSLLRYWESEFNMLQPKKNKKGDRYFRPVDIKNLALIYHLLKVRRFTISGAKEYLQNNKKALETFQVVQQLEKLKGFLMDLKNLL